MRQAVVGALALAMVAPCVKNDRVVLSASTDRNPDVLVWKSRIRLREFVDGAWPSAQRIEESTDLALAGTKAVVVTCDPSQGFVGVRILSGDLRGHYGWVRDTDAYLESVKKGKP